MLWSLLSVAIGVYAGLCLVFLVFQRSFIYRPTPVTPAQARAFTLEVPGARVRISSRPHDGPGALVYFGGNAEDVAFTVPELAEAFPDRAIYGMHYRGYGGSSGRPAETALRSDARALPRRGDRAVRPPHSHRDRSRRQAERPRLQRAALRG